MPSPKNLRELQSVIGRLSCIRRFLPQLAEKLLPLFQLTKKSQRFPWTAEAQSAFDLVKKDLLEPRVLMPPQQGKPLILYMSTMERSLGAWLAQEDESGLERPVYYLSRILKGPELNYSRAEKTCLALVFAAQRLRHSLLAHSVRLMTKASPVRYLLSQPALSGRAAKWLLRLSEFDIVCTPPKAIKGQAIADFLASFPVDDGTPLEDDIPAEIMQIEASWANYFDGAA